MANILEQYLSLKMAGRFVVLGRPNSMFNNLLGNEDKRKKTKVIFNLNRMCGDIVLFNEDSLIVWSIHS